MSRLIDHAWYRANSVVAVIEATIIGQGAR